MADPPNNNYESLSESIIKSIEARFVSLEAKIDAKLESKMGKAPGLSKWVTVVLSLVIFAATILSGYLNTKFRGKSTESELHRSSAEFTTKIENQIKETARLSQEFATKIENQTKETSRVSENVAVLNNSVGRLITDMTDVLSILRQPATPAK